MRHGRGHESPLHAPHHHRTPNLLLTLAVATIAVHLPLLLTLSRADDPWTPVAVVDSTFPPYTPTSFFPSSNCSLTFHALDNGTFIDLSDTEAGADERLIPILPQYPLAVLCPANCSREASASRPPALGALVVYGSFPYHGQSSVCLAAVHAGIIDDSVGGGVFVSRFYRHDWSNSSTQSIFPFTSAMGTLSNGVHSRDVDSSWYTVPSNASEWSYSVRGRGDYVVQRREAPFPPRADHLHVTVHRFFAYVDVHVHIIVGGRNATHYLNDVWLGHQAFTTPSPDIDWQRLPDAPFTPRSHMGLRPEAEQEGLEAEVTIAHVVGGQSAHRCGLVELGVCSDEVWEMRVTRVADLRVGVSWSTVPVFHLPFTTRCQPAVAYASDPLQSPPPTMDRLFLLGGQLSYTDPTCSSPPITVNEVWSVGLDPSTRLPLTNLTRQADAPFSPRPSTLACHSDAGGLPIPQPCYLAGGIRYTNITRIGDGQARLVQAELSAEVWGCFVDTLQPQPWQCAWSAWGRVGDNASLTSLPSPSAGGVDATFISSSTAGIETVETRAFGGWHPPSFTQLWRSTLPPLDADAIDEDYDWREVALNVSMIRVPPAEAGARSMEQVMADRAGLPLTALMTEAELNDQAGVYAMGSEWTSIAVGPPITDELTLYDTFHHQPLAFASHPNQATIYVPQAASSLNTTRPRFNFPLRRHSHRLGYVKRATISHYKVDDVFIGMYFYLSHTSGGQSGTGPASYLNDFITTTAKRCLPPVDPSFRAALGPIQLIINEQLTQYWDEEGFASTFPTITDPYASALTITCPPHHHFEPPSLDSQRPIICAANGLWMDPDSLTIRRCVRDHLPCSFPLTDLGGLYCEPMLPLITEVKATYTDADGAVHALPNTDVVTLTGLPLTGAVSLSIFGNAFLLPLRVTVGSFPCHSPTVQPTPTTPVSTVAYNITAVPGGSTFLSPQLITGAVWGALITCRLERAVGVHMRLAVDTGRLGEVTEVDPTTGRTAVTLSSAAPTLTALLANASDCHQAEDQPLTLYDCPVTRPFRLTVCASTDSVGDEGEAEGLTVALSSSPSSSTVITLDCSPFTIGPVSACAVCHVNPRLRPQVVLLSRPALGLVSREAATLSFSQCPAGSEIDYVAAASTDAPAVCRPCAEGYSTEGAQDQAACVPCTAGYYSNVTGAARCAPCMPGTYAASAGARRCDRCPVNSYANATAQTRCEVCELNAYIVYSQGGGDARVAGRCVDCPELASCGADGSIAAEAGSYLLIEQQAGTVRSTSCSATACSDGLGCELEYPSSSAELIRVSRLSVLNCCAEGRWHAYVDDPTVYAHSGLMQRTKGHNVLCAQCLPGHTSVSGHCVSCEATNWPALLGFVALALLLVYLIHRLPHDWTGCATLLITSNFLQLSTLFLASESMPQLLSLFSVNLLGDHASRGQQTGAGVDFRAAVGLCVVPLDDADRILFSLVSPIIALALLAIVFLLQVVLTRSPSPPPSPTANVDPPSSFPPLSGVRRLYQWLCTPSTPRLREPLMAPERVSGGLSSPLSTLELGVGEVREEEEEDVRLTPAPPLRLQYLRTMVRLLQLSYTSLTVVTLAFFHLQDVGEFGQRVVDYPTLSPDSAEYGHLYPVMVVLLCVVVCGAPVTLFLYLLHYHRTGRLAEMEQLHNLRAASAGQEWGGSSSSSTMSARCAVVVQLTVMYRPGCWWMAAFVLLRRLLCIALLTVVRSSAVWSWLTLLGYSLLALHMQQQPYVRLRDNQLETLTLLSLSVQTSLLSLYPPPYLSPLLLAVFNALVIGPLLPPLTSTLIAVWRACQQRKRRPSRPSW